MHSDKRLLIIGEAFVDVHLDTPENLLRLGGVFHSARALHALGRSYALAVISPGYLEKDIKENAQELLATQCSIVGNIDRSPNVILINDSTEADNQGYNDLLVNQAVSTINYEKLKKIIEDYKPTDILIFPGKFHLLEVLYLLNSERYKIHIDFQYHSDLICEIKSVHNIENIIISTSSDLFLKKCVGNPNKLIELLDGKSKGVLLKENRGGSRYFLYENNEWIDTPAFLSDTLHSVGVGDVFNSVFLTSNEEVSLSLKLASYVASWYSTTFHHESFVSNVDFLSDLIDPIKELKGIRINWESRQHQHIYIAGPDFPHINTKPITDIYNCLTYHNFHPHRPVLENGLITGKEEESKKISVYEKDIELLNKCSLLIAVLINDDPGTYVEIGWMAKSGKPTLLYDPYHKANNLFLEKTVTQICHSLNEIVDAVFMYLGSEQK